MKSGSKLGPGIRARFWSLLVLAQLPKAQKTGPFSGPHFGAGKPLLSSFLELQNLDTDREIPSNVTSSSLDAAGLVKHHEYLFFCSLFFQCHCLNLWSLGRPCFEAPFFDRFLGPKNGLEDFAAHETICTFDSETVAFVGGECDACSMKVAFFHRSSLLQQHLCSVATGLPCFCSAKVRSKATCCKDERHKPNRSDGLSTLIARKSHCFRNSKLGQRNLAFSSSARVAIGWHLQVFFVRQQKKT